MMDDNTPFIAEVLDINGNAKQSSTTSATPFIAEVLDINDNASSYPDDFFQHPFSWYGMSVDDFETKYNMTYPEFCAEKKKRNQTVLSEMMVANQRQFVHQFRLSLAQLNDEQVKKNAENIADHSEIRLLALENAEALENQSELAELRAELVTVKSELAEVRAELATVKANQSHIRAQLTEHSATLNEQAEIRAEHAELIAALAEIRADHGQILRSSAQLRAEPMEEIAELKAAIKEILATLKEMVSCS
jgi:hypothetical protein